MPHEIIHTSPPLRRIFETVYLHQENAKMADHLKALQEMNTDIATVPFKGETFLLPDH